MITTLDGTRVATFQNILRSSNTWLKANILGNSGTNRPLTIPLINQAYLRGQSNGGGGFPTLIASNHSIALKYSEILTPDRRYGADDMTLDGGFKALKYTGPGGSCPWLMDRMIRKNEVQFILEDDIKQYVLTPLEWVEEDGSVLKWVSGKDEYDAYMAEYSNLCAERCNRSTVLKDVTDT